MAASTPNKLALWRPMLAFTIVGGLAALVTMTPDCGCPPPPSREPMPSLDERTLWHLQNQGSDLSRPTEVRHILRADCGDVPRVTARLRDAGYRTEDSGPHADGTCMVVAVHEMIPNVENLAAARDELEELAPGAVQTGWDAKGR
jgi:hypothetical protein